MYRGNNAIRIDRSHVALILRARWHRLEYEKTGYSGLQSRRQSIQLAAPLDVSASRVTIERNIHHISACRIYRFTSFVSYRTPDVRGASRLHEKLRFLWRLNPQTLTNSMQSWASLTAGGIERHQIRIDQLFCAAPASL